MVVDVNSGEHQKPHLVSLINGLFPRRITLVAQCKLMVVIVAISEKKPTQQNKWHLFNDFLVRETPTADALQFEQSWKTPVILVYQIKSFRHAVDDSWKSFLDTSCLYHENIIPAKYVVAAATLSITYLTASPATALHNLHVAQSSP